MFLQLILLISLIIFKKKFHFLIPQVDYFFLKLSINEKRAPGKTARSKLAFPDEISTPIRAPHPGLARALSGPRPGLVRGLSGSILTPFLVRLDFNPKKALSGLILTPFLARLDFNPNKVSSGSILTLIRPRPGLVRLNFNPISSPA